VAALGCLIASTAAVASGHVTIRREATSTAVSVPSVTGDPRADLLLARMTLAEKLRLLEWMPGRGAGQFQAARLPGIPRLGIPTLRLVDGLPGTASRRHVPAMTAPLGVAATFSRADAYANGAVTGRNARALGEQMVGLPFADIDRDPGLPQAGGSFGEDPLLAGQTAEAEIAGMRKQHTMALVEHYIGGDSNVVLGAQALHEVYLEPFADAVRARAAAIMCGRGTVRVVATTPSRAMSPGTPDCENAGTLRRVLRGEVGFTGFVTSDWGADPATQSLNAGLDLELPGGPGAAAPAARAARGVRAAAPGPGTAAPAARAAAPATRAARGVRAAAPGAPPAAAPGMPGAAPGSRAAAPGMSVARSRGKAAFSPRAIRAAIADGSVSITTVNQAVGAILAEMDHFGLLGSAGRAVSTVPAAADDSVALRTAQDAATLLKNSGHALPLSARDLASLALIGPGAGQIIGDGQTPSPNAQHSPGAAGGAPPTAPTGAGPSATAPGKLPASPPAPGTSAPSAAPSSSYAQDTPSVEPSGTPTLPQGVASPRAGAPTAPGAAAPATVGGRQGGAGWSGSAQPGAGRAGTPHAARGGKAAGPTHRPGRGGRVKIGEPGASPALMNMGTYQVLRTYLSADPRAHPSYWPADDLTGVPVPASALSHEGEPGLVRTSAGSHAAQVVPYLDNTLASGDTLPPGSAHAWAGELTAPATGTYWINLGLLGAKGSLSLDGTTIAQTQPGPGLAPRGGITPGLAPRRGITQPTTDSVFPTTDGLDNLRTRVRLTAGTHVIGVTEVPDASGRPVQVRLNWVTPGRQRAVLNAAVAAAAHARAAVVFAWSDGGFGPALPDGQDQLIEDVAAVNKHTVVVLNTPGPVPMPWIAGVKAVLQMWYPGAGGGEATANVLLGRENPAGRLPVTWPAAAGQGMAGQARAHPERTSAGSGARGRACRGPAAPAAGAAGCTTTYSEGIFVGYRWYDERRLAPLFPFGYGISYTHFAYSGLSWWTAVGGGVAVRFRVANTGRVAGQEVAQVYLGPPASRPPGVAFAAKVLAGYARVSLLAHQSRMVTVYMPLRSFQYWDDARGWVTSPGPRPLYVGPSERTTYVTASVTAFG
jgi:beta-glucosidase-like glycosyl hydrolase